MRDIETAAEISIGRAVAFGTLAIVMVMLGLIFDPAMALKVGGAMSLLMAAILQLKALRAPTQPYRKTEAWLLLERRPTLPADHAQRLIGGTLAATYGRYAGISCGAGSAMWLAGLAFQLLA